MGEIHQLPVLPSLLTAQGGDEAASHGNKEMERENREFGMVGLEEEKEKQRASSPETGGSSGTA